jgi:F420H(2)-dependent quinone reductase
MSDPLDWNAKTIAEFRVNEGRVGGNFEGAPMVLLHHRGRKSGREYVTPTMYLPHDTGPDIIYAEQARRYAGFAEYERQTAGVRTIPVLELQRA